MRAFNLIPLGILALLAAPATLAGPPVTVVEYYDTVSHKFFMTADPAEQMAFDGAGPETTRVRTGLQFDALPADVDTCETRASGQVVCAGSIVRFDYASFDWFFYSPKPSEWAQLKAPDSGFIDRGVAFRAFLPDGPGGTCTQGRPAVYRSYRNQNHRFPADQATHQRMVSTGSADEGITFCAERARIMPLFDAPYLALAQSATQTPDQCPVLDAFTGPCLVARNLQPPNVPDGEYQAGELPQAYIDRTGFNGRFIFTEGDASVSDRAFGTFVQFENPGQLGLHVNTGNRIAQGPSSLDVAYNIERFTAPGAPDRRLMPFRRIVDVPAELSMRFLMFVKEVDFLGASSVAHGRLRISLLDTSDRVFDALAIERRVDLVVHVYGSEVAPVDGVTREGATFTRLGYAVVTTSIDRSSYGRPANNLPYLFTPNVFHSENAWGYGGGYDYRIDQAALQRIVDAAHALDAGYSRDISQYQLLGYRLENELEGPGRLGVNTRDITLQLLRR